MKFKLPISKIINKQIDTTFLCIIFVICQLLISSIEPKNTEAPNYISILSQVNLFSKENKQNVDFSHSEVNSDVVNWIQQTGTEAILVPYDMPWPQLTDLLSHTSGQVLPGGATELLQHPYDEHKLTGFMKRVNEIMKWVEKRNTKENKYFSVFGICLGLQELFISEADGDASVLTYGFKDSKAFHSVYQEDTKFKSSPLFGRLSLKESKKVFNSTNLIRYYHNAGVTPATIENNKLLKDNINVLGLSWTKENRVFVAIAEHKKLPFFMVQFHPEEQQFLFGDTMEGGNRYVEGIRYLSDLAFEFVEMTNEKRGTKLKELPERYKKFLSYKNVAYPNLVNCFGTNIYYLERYTKDAEAKESSTKI